MGLATVDHELDVATHHQLGQVILVRLGRDPRADDLATSDDRDPVGDLEDLEQLVADEDDRMTLGGEAPQHQEDVLGLLGRQHRSGFVEDEDPRVAVQRLQDLDPLLPADGEGFDLHLRVDVETEPLAKVHDAPVGLPAIQEDRIGHRLLAEEDVVSDG